MRPRPTAPHRADVLAAVVLSLLGIVGLFTEPLSGDTGVTRGADALGAALSLGMTATLAWRRSAPLISLGIAGLCALIAANVGYAVTIGVLTVWLTVGSAALHTDRRTARFLVAVGAVAVAGSVVNFAPESRTLLGVLSAAAVGTLPPLVGDALRRQRELLSEVRGLRARELEQAVTQGRVAIARDVHDSVGHYLSAIKLQAGAASLAEGTADAEPPAATFDRIEGLADRALQDTRLTLGLLRDGEGAELRPTPELTGLPLLLESSRAAGVDVALSVTGSVDEVPGATQTAAYRIAQEALTNVARHAGGARARLEIDVAAGALRLAVTDEGRSASAPAGAGRGIVGMRERAALLGGRLEAGPDPAGGWRVDAELPL